VVSEDSGAGAGGLLAGLGPGSRVGGYRLEEQVGAGGMAVVFRAHDERLGRRVALKVLAPALAADAGFRQRFLRESRAAAAVEDPHIIPVHEAGEADGVLFIAMRFVPGGDVRSLLAQAGPLPPARAAAIISPVASALDAAHAAGLVHRDVKPANMLVDVHPDRPDHVYLSDFGLSKGTVASTGLTGAGQYLGTPDYMAPEQIEGRAVDGRTDQYALACAAFELLCGEAPFRRDQGMAVLFAHLQQQPPPLAERRPELPATADAVFAQALAKDPANRYPTCRHFADALREALGVAAYHFAPRPDPAAGQPPTQHPATEVAGPHGPGAGEAAASADAAATRTIGPALRNASTPMRSAISANALAADAAHSSPHSGGDVRPPRRRRWIVLTTLGGVSVLAAVAIAAALVINSPSHASSSGHAVTGYPAATLVDPVGSSGVAAVTFSPAGHTLATGAGGGSTYLWDVATGRRTATLTDPGGFGVDALAFSRNGRVLAVGDGNGSTYLWDVVTGHRTATLTNPGPVGSGVDAVALSPNGRILATANGGDSTTFLWDAATGARISALTDPENAGVAAVAFSPNGRILAVAGDAGSTCLWDVVTGQRTATLTDPGGSGADALAFSPNGHTLATSDANGSTYLWNVTTGRPTGTLTDPHGSGADAVAFSPNGHTLATGDNNSKTYLWNIG
jgi:hypothetical protein